MEEQLEHSEPVQVNAENDNGAHDSTGGNEVRGDESTNQDLEWFAECDFLDVSAPEDDPWDVEMRMFTGGENRGVVVLNVRPDALRDLHAVLGEYIDLQDYATGYFDDGTEPNAESADVNDTNEDDDSHTNRFKRMTDPAGVGSFVDRLDGTTLFGMDLKTVIFLTFLALTLLVFAGSMIR